MNSNTKTLLSGIQPTGEFTIGNYLGAIKNWKECQVSSNCIFFIANLHSLTVSPNASELENATIASLALMIACGIDPKRSLVFVQSTVKQHTELAWFLQCCTQFGELARMTQFKDKAKKATTNNNAGLFSYPVLMAADILLYEPDIVPIGHDQQQHMELTIKLAKRFNRIHGQTFKEPHYTTPQLGNRIKSLTHPTNKMSKSDSNKNSTIFLLDDEATILNKIKKATTDAGTEIKHDPQNKPGISNLMEIYASFAGCSLDDTQQLFKHTNYGTFKKEVAITIAKHLEPIRLRYQDIIAKQQYLKEVIEQGAVSATKIAAAKMEQIKQKIGII